MYRGVCLLDVSCASTSCSCQAQGDSSSPCLRRRPSCLGAQPHVAPASSSDQ
ncbi:hypothetical protein PF005_g3744 [Phytophthora fragariae]|uniref:Uncharacterized protein n=1 Tax=Phytophthora fragariae TaxID=53985 RepID=A0A6A3Z771_9STRA|nr:hypothetical protein PF003_g39040 [Phytophthora fragariae]KAE8947587.1 hypothetical protein PF009_g2813 [Phytophthora fragariae]KAE9024985.1 hypothetical protein PF011_g3248 [Phytophthora fragariae]KAE9131641.1 hypothetical protein PF010_g3461 [Phytophthora fragariae]KAE9132928.1 hypothetical protein PF007_g3538 [Phytophthora fragariae]